MSSVRLNELTDSDLPARLSFCDFIYGATDTSFDVSSNDLIDIHFFKRSVVAHVLLLPAGRKMVKIPLNADFKITFVPEDIDSDCILTATQIVEMAADRLPKILIVKKGCKISADHRASKSSSISSLFEGELLIIKNRSNNIINCFSFLSKSEKLFDKTQSDLVFSVNPSNTKLSFSDLIHLDTAGCLPLQIKLHPSKKKLERWFQMPCTIYSLEKEDSVIASLHTKTEKTKLYEISSAIPIDFIRVSLTKHEGVLLLEKSLFFYENFNPSKVKIILDEHNEKLKFERETYQMLKSGNDWNETIEIFKPAAICSSLQSTKHGQILSTQKEIISSMSIQEAHDQSYYALLNPVSIDKEDNCYAQHIHQYEYTEHVQPASYYNHPMEISKCFVQQITNFKIKIIFMIDTQSHEQNQ